MQKTPYHSFVLILCLLFCCSIAMAQQEKKAITNADIIELTKAGLPESTIILAIQQGPTKFDTSSQALIELKDNGVSPNVLNAMLVGGTTMRMPNQSGITNTLPQTQERESRVVLLDGTNRIQMKYSLPDHRGSGSMFNPLGKTKVKDALKGNHAQVRTINTSPIFEVELLSEQNPSDQITIIKFSVKSDRREVESFRAGITGVSHGYRDKDIIPVTIEELPKVSYGHKYYKVKLINPLLPDEYAFVLGSLYYDFGVDRGK